MFPLKDEIKSFSFPIVSYTIILINIFVYVYQYFLYPDPLELAYKYGLIPSKFDFFNVLTSMFLHGGFFHLFSNMLFLYIFGDNVEDVFGHLKFLIFYLISGICASIFHILIYPNSNVPMIGASGAISGILGAYIVFFPFSRIFSFVFLPFIYIGFANIPAIVYIGIWFINQLIQGIFGTLLNISTNIAFWAHIGGFITGLLIAILFLPFSYRKIRRKRFKIID